MSRSAFRINSAITVEGRHGAVGKRWMELLAAIGSEQSITAAAKCVGMSYKAAWDAVEAMNNLADRALVERVVRGKGGGGTRLTANGERLVVTYREVETENARFLERLNARIAGGGIRAETDREVDHADQRTQSPCRQNRAHRDRRGE